MKRSPRQQKGFTLVELLVAITIIAILAFLGLSVSKGVRGKADDVRCISNLRQTGQAMLNYFADHNGQMLPKKYWFQYTSTRASANKGMREYFQVDPDLPITDPRLFVDTVLTCPAMLKQYPALRETMFRRGVAINYYLYQTDGDRDVSGYKTTFAHPSIGAMMMFGDAPVSGGAENPEATGLLGSINDNTAYHATEFMPYPHAGKKNHFVFYDGHVEALSKEELRDRPNQKDFWGATHLFNERN